MDILQGTDKNSEFVRMENAFDVDPEIISSGDSGRMRSKKQKVW